MLSTLSFSSPIHASITNPITTPIDTMVVESVALPFFDDASPKAACLASADTRVVLLLYVPTEQNPIVVAMDRISQRILRCVNIDLRDPNAPIHSFRCMNAGIVILKMGEHLYVIDEATLMVLATGNGIVAPSPGGSRGIQFYELDRMMITRCYNAKRNDFELAFHTDEHHADGFFVTTQGFFIWNDRQLMKLDKRTGTWTVVFDYRRFGNYRTDRPLPSRLTAC
jgi:hypothetical protein